METKLDRITFEAAVTAEAAGWSTPAEQGILEADRPAWAAALRRLIFQTDDDVVTATRLGGEEREQVLADLEAERGRLAAALNRLTGDEIALPRRLVPGATNGAVPKGQNGAVVPVQPSGPPRLQGSWADGRVVVWAGGPGAEPVEGERQHHPKQAASQEDASQRKPGTWSDWGNRHESLGLPAHPGPDPG